MASTIKLQNTLNWAQSFVRLIPLAGQGGVNGEPALTNANNVRQFMLAPPFAWRWNRNSTSFTTNNSTPTQSYTVGLTDFGWIERATVSDGTTIWQLEPRLTLPDSNDPGRPLDISPEWENDAGGTNLVTNLSSYVVTGTGSPETVNSQSNTVTVVPGATYTLSSYIDGTNLISGGAWLTVFDPTVSTQYGSSISQTPGQAGNVTVQWTCPENVTQVKVVLSLNNSTVTNGKTLTFSNGSFVQNNVTFKLYPVPETTVNYTVKVIYQMKPQIFASLQNIWTPIPDEMAYIYNAGFLAGALENIDDARFQLEYQKFVRSLIAANDGLTEEEVNIFLGERLINQKQTQGAMLNVQQGRGARAS
jgi:hypothetical protein